MAPGANANDKDDVDIYRNTPVRYLGYANEIGEAFRYQLPGFVLPSYGVSIGYVVADTYDKYRRDKTESKYVSALDTLVWQGLASVAVPGITIHTVVKVSKSVVPRAAPPVIKSWLPTLCGLGAIPFIVHPIDEAVTLAMDQAAELGGWRRPK